MATPPGPGRGEGWLHRLVAFHTGIINRIWHMPLRYKILFSAQGAYVLGYLMLRKREREYLGLEEGRNVSDRDVVTLRKRDEF